MQLLLLALGAVTVAAYLLKTFSAKDETALFYESQPCPGRKQQLFSWCRATIRSFSDTHKRVAEGYDQFGKEGKPFIVPNARYGPICVIPPSQLRFILGKPEEEVEAHALGLDMIQSKYTLRDPAVYPSNFEVPIIKRLTRDFGQLTKVLAEEIALAFDDSWGMNTEEWRDMKTWRSLEYVASRALNRILIGAPLCRHEPFIQRSLNYSRAIMGGIAIKFIPDLLKPLFGPLMSRSGTRDCDNCIDMLVPLVRERISSHREGSVNSNDVLQWLIQESSKHPDPSQLDPRRLARRLVVLNFNAVPPAGMTLTHLLSNLYSQNRQRCEENVRELRNECENVLKITPEGYWTREAVEKLRLVDSAIRESMRHSDFGALAMPRRVSAPNGIEISGIRIPRGVHMEVPVHCIHMDSSNYNDPATFSPFRFAGMLPNCPDHRKSVVATDDAFLGFGYGKNSCPGRFFGAHLMKTMLAYILQHYIVEYMPERPKDVIVMEFRAPSDATQIRIRRRK